MSEPSTSSSAEAQQGAGDSAKDWCKRMMRKGRAGLIEEFNTIKAEKLPGTTTAYEQNVALNRYGNITLLDKTRVILDTDGLQQPYIHASYVDGFNQPKAYIITQAPPMTALIDYWRMVWQERVTLIVCLTSLRERGASKADIFFPPELSRPFRAGPFRVIAESISPIPGHSRVALLHLRLRCWFAKKGTPDRLVVMIYYGKWPDTAVPQDTPQFLKFVKLIKMFESWTADRAPPGDQRPPVLVHCSAGVGRSATLVACRIVLDQLEATDTIDVPAVVKRMRRQRAMAVQNVLQYIFINLLVAEAARQQRNAQGQ